jgi:hypothetical protein
MKKVEKIDFQGYVSGLTESQKVDLRDKVMKKTGCAYATYYYWLRNPSAISKLNKRAIAGIVGKNVAELWPVKEVVL